MWKKTINSCHIFKNVSRQVLPCQKFSVFENEYNFFNQRNDKYLEEHHQFLPPFKKCIPTKVSVFEIE